MRAPVLPIGLPPATLRLVRRLARHKRWTVAYTLAVLVTEGLTARNYSPAPPVLTRGGRPRKTS